MEALIVRIATAAGVDAETSRQAVSIVLAFLAREAPSAELSALTAAFPGAADAAESARDAAGPPGMGIMGLASALGGAGLSMDQMTALAREFVAAGRDAVGEDAMGTIVGSVPGLAQYI